MTSKYIVSSLIVLFSGAAFAMPADVAHQPGGAEALLAPFIHMLTNPRVCAAGQVTTGTDVSNYNPGTDWTVARKAGLGFTFIKATEGTTLVNRIFSSDWAAAKTSGLVRGAYHFFHPANDPLAEAKHFLATMPKLGATDLPPVFDWEVTDGQTSKVQIAKALIWLNAVEKATGRTPILYVAPAFWNALGNPAAFARYPLFIANYDVSCPGVPAPWKTWTFWQLKVGPVAGVKSAEADQDHFNGTPTTLVSFIRNGHI